MLKLETNKCGVPSYRTITILLFSKNHRHHLHRHQSSSFLPTVCTLLDDQEWDYPRWSWEKPEWKQHNNIHTRLWGGKHTPAKAWEAGTQYFHPWYHYVGHPPVIAQVTQGEETFICAWITMLKSNRAPTSSCSAKVTDGACGAVLMKTRRGEESHYVVIVAVSLYAASLSLLSLHY